MYKVKNYKEWMEYRSQVWLTPQKVQCQQRYADVY